MITYDIQVRLQIDFASQKGGMTQIVVSKSVGKEGK